MENGNTSIRNDVSVMRDAVFFEGPSTGQRLSRFWILLTLSAIIATAGVVADSTATVIGAMIVAPMLMPIQGTVLATVLGDRKNLVRSVALVIAGAAAAIIIGYLVGLVIVNDIVAETRTQVASRVHPGLIDLLAALGTGVVGSIALIRKDISDTLPGVAIAISLVPPLVVAGLTLEAGEVGQSMGALLLFVTNVTAILATGIVVMAVYGVHRIPAIYGEVAGRPVNKRHAILVIVAMVLVVGAPLSISSFKTSSEALRESHVRDAAEAWAKESGWDLLEVDTVQGEVVVRVTGPMPLPETANLEKLISEAGIDPKLIDVDMVPSYTTHLGGE